MAGHRLPSCTTRRQQSTEPYDRIHFELVLTHHRGWFKGLRRDRYKPNVLNMGRAGGLPSTSGTEGVTAAATAATSIAWRIF